MYVYIWISKVLRSSCLEFSTSRCLFTVKGGYYCLHIWFVCPSGSEWLSFRSPFESLRSRAFPVAYCFSGDLRGPAETSLAGSLSSFSTACSLRDFHIPSTPEMAHPTTAREAFIFFFCLS